MRMKYVQRLAIFLIMLVLSLPIVMAARDTVGSTTTSYGDGENFHSGVDTTSNIDDVSAFEDTQTFAEYEEELPQGAPDVKEVSDAGEQCIEKHEETSALVDALGGEILSTVTMVFRMLKGVCKVLSMVDLVLSGITSLFGRAPCCVLMYIPVYGAALYTSVCEPIQNLYHMWETIYIPLGGGLCCMINCNWCKGQNCLQNLVDSGKMVEQNKAQSEAIHSDVKAEAALDGTNAEGVELNEIRNKDTGEIQTNDDGELLNRDGDVYKNKEGKTATLNKEQKEQLKKSNENMKNSKDLTKKANARKSNVGVGGKVLYGLATVGGGMYNYVFTGEVFGVEPGARSNWITGKDEGEGSNVISDFMGTFGFDPYESIYVAGICFCLPGILFNVEKLKTIYKAYDCCIEQACINGISTEPCEKMLAEATCMFWEGSALSALLKVVMGIVTGIVKLVISKMLPDVVLAALGCIIPLYHLKDLPDMIKGLGDTFSTETIDDMSCEDLGFGELKDSRENAENGAKRALANAGAGEINNFEARDRNGDGILDNVGISGGNELGATGDSNETQNYTYAGILYLDPEGNMMYYSVETGTKDAEIEDLEDRFVFIEDGDDYYKYDFTNTEVVYNKSDESDFALQKDGITYEISKDTHGNIIVSEVDENGEKTNKVFNAAVNPQLARDLNNLAKEQAEDLVELVKEVTAGQDQLQYSSRQFPPYYYPREVNFKPFSLGSEYNAGDKGRFVFNNGVLDTEAGTFNGEKIGDFGSVNVNANGNLEHVNPKETIFYYDKGNGEGYYWTVNADGTLNSLQDYNSDTPLELDGKNGIPITNNQLDALQSASSGQAHSSIVNYAVKEGKTLVQDSEIEGTNVGIREENNDPLKVEASDYSVTKTQQIQTKKITSTTRDGKSGYQVDGEGFYLTKKEAEKAVKKNSPNAILNFVDATNVKSGDLSINQIQTLNNLGWTVDEKGVVKTTDGQTGQLNDDGTITFKEPLKDGTKKVTLNKNGQTVHETDVDAEEGRMGADSDSKNKIKIVKINGIEQYREYTSTFSETEGNHLIRINSNKESYGVRSYSVQTEGEKFVEVTQLATSRGAGWTGGDKDYIFNTPDGSTYRLESEGIDQWYEVSSDGKWTEIDEANVPDDVKLAHTEIGADGGANEQRNRRDTTWSLAQMFGVEPESQSSDYASHLSAMQSRMMEEGAYGLAWAVVMETLGKWGQAWIEDYCKEEYEASEPMNDGPQKIRSRGPGANSNTEKCMGEVTTIATTQILDRYKYVNEFYKYEYMYSVTACESDVDFTVELQSCTDPNTCDKEEVLKGNVILGKDKAGDEIAELPGNYNEICIETTKTQRLCVPYEGNITQLNITGGNATNTTNATDESCEDEFNIVVTKNNNNYRWLYEVRQCEPDSYAIAFANNQEYDSESIVDNAAGSRAFSGVFQSETDYSEMCYIATTNKICKDFTNTVTGTGNGTGNETETTVTETQFDKTITKTQNNNVYTYQITYRIIPSDTMTISTYLTGNNLIMDLETNKLISDTHDYEQTKEGDDYTQICIDTSDETFGEEGLLCEDIE